MNLNSGKTYPIYRSPRESTAIEVRSPQVDRATYKMGDLSPLLGQRVEGARLGKSIGVHGPVSAKLRRDRRQSIVS